MGVHKAEAHVGHPLRHHGLDKEESHIDGGDDEEGEGGADVGPDKGEGELEELGQPPGAVQPRAFVEGDGDGGHRGHVHHHVVADGLPHHSDDDTGDNHGLILPQHHHRLAGEKGENAVEHPVFRLINGGEDASDNHHRKDVRDIEDDAEEVLSPDILPGEDGGKDDGKEKGDDGDSDDKKNGVLHGDDKLGILEECLEVRQSHKGLLGGVGPPLEEGHPEDVEGGQNHKEKIEDCGRGDAQEQKEAAALAGAHGITPFAECRGQRSR